MSLKKFLILTVCVTVIESISDELISARNEVKRRELNIEEDQSENSPNIILNSDESQKLGGLPIELTREIDANLSICNERCLCWKTPTSNGCSYICKEGESSCLEPKFSTCNADDFSIKYNEGGVEKMYICTYAKRNPGELSTRSKMIIIFGSTFICIMLIAIGYLCMRIYQTRHETGAHEIPISLLMKF